MILEQIILSHKELKKSKELKKKKYPKSISQKEYKYKLVKTFISQGLSISTIAKIMKKSEGQISYIKKYWEKNDNYIKKGGGKKKFLSLHKEWLNKFLSDQENSKLTLYQIAQVFYDTFSLSFLIFRLHQFIYIQKNSNSYLGNVNS